MTALVALFLAAEVANLSGAWNLNVDKSKWGKRRKPAAVEVSVEHREPAFKYSGQVQQDTEGQTTEFAFEGAIDGKPYPVTGGNIGGGTMTLKRVNPRTIDSEAKSQDGRVVETARTTISADGRTLTRNMRLRTPSGEASWTEVYERDAAARGQKKMR